MRREGAIHPARPEVPGGASASTTRIASRIQAVLNSLVARGMSAPMLAPNGYIIPFNAADPARSNAMMIR
ncbi:MAG TPA: hypothetical protein VFE34_13765 [Dongiaceae bacterium]|nr:hypothetical protein [Dongiaceae bacterium]